MARAYGLPLLAALMVAAGPAHAVTVNFTAANFFNPIGGTNNSFANLDGLAGNERFSFGQPASTAGPNVFTFGSAGATVVPLDTQFDLGTFSFANTATSPATHATGVSLSLTSSITADSGTFSESFLFQLALDATDNTPGTCVYPSTVACADAVTFAIVNGTGVFMDGGTAYTLFIDGFRGSDGTFSSVFVGQENATTTATVVGRFAAAIPEPMTWSMMIAGFGLVGGAMRRRVSVAYA